MNHSPRLFIALLVFTCFFFPAKTLTGQDSKDLTIYTNPLIGTKGIWFYGRTTPFVTPPFGMTHWTACTRPSHIANGNYNYYDMHIIGFRASHKPAMWMGDYGFVTLKPTTGAVTEKSLKQKALYNHFHEVSKPYYYAVGMTEPNLQNIHVEMTATERCGMLKFDFAKKQTPNVLIEASQLPDFNGWIKIDTSKHEVIGWNSDRQSSSLGPPLPNFKGYFVIQFDKAFNSWGTWENEVLKKDSTSQLANACGAWVTFGKNTRTVIARIGTSFISLEQAQENLQKEIANADFEQIKEQTHQKWNEYLSRIEIDGGNKNARHIFYSAMYHALLFPRQFSEYGRYYSAFDDKIHNGVSYNDYSLWDTYRALHPLLILMAPEHVPGMVNSLIQMYQEGGYMPKWPNPTYTGIMIATHADAVVADAIVKGIKGIDLQKAYDACMKDAMVSPAGDSLKRWADRAPWSGYEARAGLSWYMKLGYVPVDKTNESVANTLEGAFDDYCVAQVAKAAGKMDSYDLLMKRSKNYLNVYNATTGFMAPKLANGQWGPNPGDGFTEGSKWTYLFAVQHDVPGLINLMGKDLFVKRLNENFRGGRYIHGNEPGHHYCFLFDYAGMAWRTQWLVAYYRAIKYRNDPDGMDGDDDCGQMSAWYIFSCLGFYPVTPGSDVYAIGTPKFPKTTLYFDPEHRGKKFEIIAHNVSPLNLYIQSATLNGKKLDSPFLHHQDIEAGGQLVFEMGPSPKKNW